MASSSFNPHVTLEVGEEEYPYPYPSILSAASFVSVKLSGRDKYAMWQKQMLCLLKSHEMVGFIDGTFVRSTETSVSGKEKVGDHQIHRLWARSDALVQGWILGSLSEQTLGYVMHRLTDIADFSAKHVWDELHSMYGPVVLPPLPIATDFDQQEEETRTRVHHALYHATLTGYSNHIDNVLRRNKEVTVIDKIINNGNTAIHIAVGTSKTPGFLEYLLELTPENTQLLDVRNSDGSTLLHVAAIVGNTEAAKILVARDPHLLFAKDNEGHTPLAIALSNMHTQTSQFLLHHDIGIKKDTLFSGKSGDHLLVIVISSKDFRFASVLLRRYTTLHSDSVLMAIAQNFPCKPNIWTYNIPTSVVLSTAADYIIPLCGHRLEIIMRPFILVSYWIVMLFPVILLMLVSLFVKERLRTHYDAIMLLKSVCFLLKKHTDPSPYYTNPILEATRQNAYKVVEEVVSHFPNAIWSTNEDGYNIIQYAVISRSEEVYNLVYQMSEHKNVYRTIKDSSGNNLLHLAARLAPSNKLNLISGAALQIQRELQWFKEVEGFGCPLNIIQKNSFGETPHMVFTREHKDLVVEGEKWMKATAESYTITAALITTIVFAAAITVPGGNNQDTGIPLFTNIIAFRIFAISDAISLFTAVTSLLMFLSILTARFAEQDFLFKLPTKLIIGLATLFISTTTMILAFGATLYLVFGQSNSKIIIPIALLTCLPITSFVTLQFPLVIDLIKATYGRSIFGKKRDKPFY
ncbi:unnamed protein product [Lactuca virosa]|uniref:PGG domain-containing protein n=1 Tax=Lactuca virosa TaxID=75947 RepID=A0AAU9PGM1_9ASTR|nr:unnamed protein product [Lactuca virosa]